MSLRANIANGGGEKRSSSSLSQGSEEKQKKLLASDAGHFSMIKALHLADLITELNGFCGFMSILSSMRYCLGPPDSYGPIWAALAFMPFGLFFDFMDGKVARWRGKSSLMGQELDSLADLVRDCDIHAARLDCALHICADDHFGFRRWKETSEFNRLLSCSRDPKFRSASIKSGREVHSVPILTHHSPFRSPSESPPPSAPLLSACEPLSTRYYSRSLSFVASPASPVSTSPLPTCLKTQLGNPSILKGHQSRRA